MNAPVVEGTESEWFRALLDTAADVYFRYALLPARRFVYLSPSVHALTGHTPVDFYADASLCPGLVAREDRRLLHQVLRARRGLTLTLRFICHGAVIPVDLRTIAVVRHRRVVAIEGIARLAGAAPRTMAAGAGVGTAPPFGGEPMQQRLASLMYEVHDLLHRVLPPAPGASRVEPSNVLRLGSLAIDLERLVATDAGNIIPLAAREMLLLRYLLQRPGRVVTRQQLLADVWGYTYTGDARTVDVHLSRLRRKLPSLRDRLVTVKHIGYRLDRDVDEAPSRTLSA
jgi:DNA-binding winged helix-turn-helix (wHTH) protein